MRQPPVAPAEVIGLNLGPGGRMFEDSLFASGDEHDPTRWTAVLSFAAQTLLVGIFLGLPMLFTDALPLHALKPVVQIRSMPRAVPNPPNSTVPHRSEESLPDALRVPRSIPRGIAPDTDTSRNTTANIGPPDLSGIETSGSQELLIPLINSGPLIIPMIQPSHKSVKVSSGVAQGLLIEKVNPIYPAIARNAGVQGEVILAAVIGKDGRIENLHAVSGHPFLIKAALDAVQKWRYRPYMLNGEPVEVETRITVRFSVS